MAIRRAVPPDARDHDPRRHRPLRQLLSAASARSTCRSRSGSSRSEASGTACRFWPSWARTSSATTSRAATTASTPRFPIFSRCRSSLTGTLGRLHPHPATDPHASGRSSTSASPAPSPASSSRPGVDGRDVPVAGGRRCPQDFAGAVYEFGEPLLFKAVAWLTFGPVPEATPSTCIPWRSPRGSACSRRR